MSAIICFIAILVQQVLVAATTIVIARAASAVANGVSPVQPILLFCVLLLAATLPDPLIEVEKERSKYALFNKAISRAASANYGASGAYFNKAVRSDKEPYIDTELWITVSDNVAFATDAFATLLNIVLNTVAVASVLNASFGYAFMASGAISLIGSALSFGALGKQAARSQEMRAQLFGVVRRAIDNIWIGNASNFKDWNSCYRGRVQRSRNEQSRLSFERSGLSSLTSFVASVPFVAAVVSYAVFKQNEPAALATLISVLPRQVAILQNMGVAVSYAVQLSERISRTKLVYANLLLTPKERASHGNISWDDLRVYGSSMGCEPMTPREVADIAVAARDFAPGRITVRGANGCGKSTLLAEIKESLGDRAYLLPAQHDLFFSSLEGLETSSGEKTSRILDLIEGDYLEASVGVLLLDEWDANLDGRARKRHDEALNEIARDRCVVEVLHNERAGAGGESTT